MNFLKRGNDVVIDYVTFPQEAEWLQDNLRNFNIVVVYVVLWTDNDTLLKRDGLRIPQHRMGERGLILVDEFKQSGLNDKHLLNTSQKNAHDIDSIIEEITKNPKYQMKST